MKITGWSAEMRRFQGRADNPLFPGFRVSNVRLATGSQTGGTQLTCILISGLNGQTDMEKEEIRQLVGELFEARLANDKERILSLMSPHCALEIAGGEPNDSIRRAISEAEVREYIDYIFSIWRWVDVQIHKLLIDGNNVAVYYTLTSVFTPINHDNIGEVAEFLTFEDGLLKDSMVFVDTEEVSRLMKIACGGQSEL